MPNLDATVLPVASRDPSGSRQARRLRRSGLVPGVVYGGGKDPFSFQIDARELRHALQSAGAVLELQVDGGRGTPVVVKELSRHPVNGEITHLDLLRVRLDVEIQATVTLELSGGEDSPGVKDGGILEHVTRELTVEALPTDIPDSIVHDVSEMAVGDTLLLDAIAAPPKVKILGDPDVVIATLTPPRLQVEATEEIEAETEVVGEGEAPAKGEAGEEAAAEGGEPAADADSSGGE
jgi:large subunit ribosomal protein L25